MNKLVLLSSLFFLLLTQTACEEDDEGTAPETDGTAVVETFLTRF